MLGVAVGGTAIIYKYFYFLDAFFYTCEFYWLFNVNNLQAAMVASSPTTVSRLNIRKITTGSTGIKCLLWEAKLKWF